MYEPVCITYLFPPRLLKGEDELEDRTEHVGLFRSLPCQSTLQDQQIFQVLGLPRDPSCKFATYNLANRNLRVVSNVVSDTNRGCRSIFETIRSIW